MKYDNISKMVSLEDLDSCLERWGNRGYRLVSATAVKSGFSETFYLFFTKEIPE